MALAGIIVGFAWIALCSSSWSVVNSAQHERRRNASLSCFSAALHNAFTAEEQQCKVCSTASDRRRWTPPDDSNKLMRRAVPDAHACSRSSTGPKLLRDDWAVAKTRLTGICGSDAKMVFMDFGDDFGDGALNGYFTFPTVFGHEVVADVVEVGPGRHHPRGGPARRPQPVALLRASGHRPAVPVVPGRRLQPVLALHRGPDRGRHPHRHVEGRTRRFRRVLARPRVDAHSGPRRRERRGGGPGRPLRRVAALGHPPSAAAGRQGPRLRRRRARHAPRPPSSVPSTPTSRSWSWPAGPPRRRWRAGWAPRWSTPSPSNSCSRRRPRGRAACSSASRAASAPDGAPRRHRRRLRHGRARRRRPRSASGCSRHAAPWSRAACTRRSAGSGRPSTSRRSPGWAPTPSASRRSTACACTASRTTCAWPTRAGST